MTMKWASPMASKSLKSVWNPSLARNTWKTVASATLEDLSVPGLFVDTTNV